MSACPPSLLSTKQVHLMEVSGTISSFASVLSFVVTVPSKDGMKHWLRLLK